MTTSAVNTLPGEVLALDTGPLNSRVRLRLRGGQRLDAVLTTASAQALGLGPGDAVQAIVPPGAVTLVQAAAPAPAPLGGNLLQAEVDTLVEGTVNRLVRLRLPGGLALCATVSAAAVAELGLAPGVAVQAWVPASQLVLTS